MLVTHDAPDDAVVELKEGLHGRPFSRSGAESAWTLHEGFDERIPWKNCPRSGI